MKDMTVRQFCERYRKGDFAGTDRDTQIGAGWYDWFCPVSELTARLKKMWVVLDGITNDFLLDNFKVSFANKCPADSNPLYDVIIFKPFPGLDLLLDIEPDDRDLGFMISVGNERAGYKYSVETERNNYAAEACSDDVQEIIDFCNNWETALQDKTFYEERDRRNAEMKSLCDKADDLLRRIDAVLNEDESPDRE